MKIVIDNESSKLNKGNGLLPLIPAEAMPLTKDNSIGLLLATDAADMANSPKFKMQARILNGGEDVRTILSWKQDR